MNKVKLNLPEYHFSIRTNNNKAYILDILRKKYVVLTPEEWVRQHIIAYLIEHKNYPAGRMVVEYEFNYHTLTKRSDLVVFNSKGIVLMVVECKAPNVPITQKTFEQILQYNHIFHASYILVSNGIENYCCNINSSDSYNFLPEVPDYAML